MGSINLQEWLTELRETFPMFTSFLKNVVKDTDELPDTQGKGLLAPTEMEYGCDSHPPGVNMLTNLEILRILYYWGF